MTEADWKSLRGIKAELLDTLCQRINTEIQKILADSALSEHGRYMKAFKHILESDKVVAACFDDWRRSKLLLRCLSLMKHDLLGAQHIDHLSEPARAHLLQLSKL